MAFKRGAAANISICLPSRIRGLAGFWKLATRGRGRRVVIPYSTSAKLMVNPLNGKRQLVGFVSCYCRTAFSGKRVKIVGTSQNDLNGQLGVARWNAEAGLFTQYSHV
jgi:hypothetical protein